MPQKRRKPNEESASPASNDNENNCSVAKVVETLNNNLTKTKNDLKTVIRDAILELVKLFEFDP